MLCKVQGKLQRPDGAALAETVTFRPSRGGTFDGNTFAPSRVECKLDAAGAFVARLAPSSIVGDYEAVCGAFVWRVTVPDEAWARFADVAALT